MKKSLLQLIACLFLLSNILNSQTTTIIFNETFTPNPFSGIANTTIPVHTNNDECKSGDLYKIVNSGDDFCYPPPSNGTGQFMVIDNHYNISNPMGNQLLYGRDIPKEDLECKEGSLTVTLMSAHRLGPGDFREATLRLDVYDFNGALIPNSPELIVPTGTNWQSLGFDPVTVTNGVSLININWIKQGGQYRDFSVDNIMASYNSEPGPDPVASLTDENGNPISTVCIGEDIYFDASLSTNYDEYFISIWETDGQGNNLNYARFDSPKWRTGPIPFPYNLSADIASGTWAYTNAPPSEWAFCEGGNYSIQFALRSDCDGWEAINIPFTVEKCSEPYIEVVSEGCGTTNVRVKFSENWVSGGDFFSAIAPATITSQSYSNGYYTATVSSPVDGFATVRFNVIVPCDELDLTASVYICNSPPTIPDVPPIDLEYICLNEEFSNYCYDFKYFNCLTNLIVEPTHPKIIVTVDGTKVCMESIWYHPFTFTLIVTPVGPCGPGETVYWTIYVNDPERCEEGGDDDWDVIPLMTNPNNNTAQSHNIDLIKEKTGVKVLDKSEITVYPNPFKETLEVRTSSKTQGFLMKIFNATGKLILESNDLENPVNTGQLSPGMYFTKILDSNGQLLHTEKLIKAN